MLLLLLLVAYLLTFIEANNHNQFLWIPNTNTNTNITTEQKNGIAPPFYFLFTRAQP
tara:strand:- start:373 stop:543 length:171 start_codon:yes stop_codon:yes gene_type:complete